MGNGTLLPIKFQIKNALKFVGMIRARTKLIMTLRHLSLRQRLQSLSTSGRLGRRGFEIVFLLLKRAMVCVAEGIFSVALSSCPQLKGREALFRLWPAQANWESVIPILIKDQISWETNQTRWECVRQPEKGLRHTYISYVREFYFTFVTTCQT